MNLQECYESFGGSYTNIKSRLLKDDLIQRLIIKFLSDTSYKMLVQTMENKDYGEAFRAAHTLKGICQNLSFDCLSKSTSEITEALRKWDSELIDEKECEQLLHQVSIDYKTVTDAIVKLKEFDEQDNK